MRCRRLLDDGLRQQRYFERARNQYPRSALLEPPLHTALEMQRIVNAVGDVPSDGPIVDFGAGTGRLSIALARTGHRVLAVDVSRSSLDTLEDAAGELGLGSIETATALPSGTFSAVVGADILHHVDMNEYLPRIHAILRTGGKAIFSEPGALNPTWYLYLPLSHDVRVEVRIFTCNIANLRRQFRRHGFRDVTIVGLGFLPRPLFRSRARACRRHDAMGNWPVLRWFAYRYIVEATK